MKLLRRRIRRRGRFRFHFRAGALRFRLIRIRRRATLDRHLRDWSTDVTRALHGSRGKHRSHDRKDVAPNRGLRRFGFLDVVLTLQAHALQRSTAASAQCLVIGSLVDDRGVVVGDVGHVCRFIDDRDIALHRHYRALDILRSDLLVRNEDVLVDINVVIAISPFLDACAPLESRFRRKWGPADMLIARPP